MATGQMDLLRTVTRRLKDAGVPAASCAARFLVTEILECSTAQLLADPMAPVSDAAAIRIMESTERCTMRMPVQYAIGYAYFRGLRLRVTPDVLIPRPETEQLVDKVLAHMVHGASPRVLDIGTGSGCIALAFKAAFPNARVTGCDISRPALYLAKYNAASLDMDVDFLQADILDPKDPAWQRLTGFDVLVSNPPYIPDHEWVALQPEVRDYEPAIALFCGEDPLEFYQAIVSVMKAGVLRPKGLIAVEAHVDYAMQVAALFEAAGVGNAKIINDLAGMSRFILARSS